MPQFAYRFFDGPPDCSDVCDKTTNLPDTDDASDGGVRCDGPGCLTPGEEITELEVHNHINGIHFTLYGNNLLPCIYPDTNV
jgi:hypothetical protein